LPILSRHPRSTWSAFEFGSFGSFYFWLDTVAVLSVSYDMSLIFHADATQTVVVDGDGSDVALSRAGYACRAAIQGGRFVWMLRSMRLVRLVRLLRMYEHLTRQARAAATQVVKRVEAVRPSSPTRPLLALSPIRVATPPSGGSPGVSPGGGRSVNFVASGKASVNSAAGCKA
ncbi:unnamed protein product, partial [Phaeothamnion confervicola]